MPEIIKHSETIWEWKYIYDKPSELLNRLLENKYWASYNNFGGGSTLIGRCTKIFKEDEAYQEIKNVFTRCLNDYIKEKNLQINEKHIGDSDWLVREYSAGSKMYEHRDAYSYVVEGEKDVVPLLTIILYLNDDFSGGEIYFKEDDILIKPSPGSVVLFNSRNMHEVRYLSEGNRYLTQAYVYEKDFSNYSAKDFSNS